MLTPNGSIARHHQRNNSNDDGNRHNNENLPVLLADNAGGLIDSGRHIRVARETPMCNLFMSMLDRFGTPVDFVGDSTGCLSELQL